MLTRKNLDELTFPEIIYEQILVNCVSYKQKPYYAVIFDTDPKRKSMTIYKKSVNGYVTTKRITISKKDLPLIQDYLSNDYPEIVFKNLDVETL